jgi:uncharacterized membrane protein
VKGSDPGASREVLVGLPPNRIETLVDGIFAVAMTILVLELHVPALGREISERALSEALGDLLPRVLSYASGFVILGTLWVGHHYQFHYIQRTNRALLWINLVFLLAITFLPFVVALIGSYGAMRVPCVMYGTTLLVAGTCLLAQWLYAAGPSRRLVGAPVRSEVFRGIRNRVAAGMVGYGIGLALAFFAPSASLVCYAAMPLLYLLPSGIDRHMRAPR